jgi:hypothetical protein
VILETRVWKADGTTIRASLCRDGNRWTITGPLVRLPIGRAGYESEQEARQAYDEFSTRKNDELGQIYMVERN